MGLLFGIFIVCVGVLFVEVCCCVWYVVCVWIIDFYVMVYVLIDIMNDCGFLIDDVIVFICE